MPSFYNGKRFFLTYPRCEEEPAELQSFLEQAAPVNYILIAREQHEDGGLHLHACVEFKTSQRHGVDWLDFKDKHPNKQDPRRWDACKTYCKKDGDIIEKDYRPVEEPEQGLDLAEACKGYNSEEAWMSFCVSEKIGFQYATWFWNRVHSDMSTLLHNEYPGKICDSLMTYYFDWTNNKTLILKGESGCGKTTWAKVCAPKPALFVTHVDELKTFRPGYHISIIFDDVDFSHYPRTSQIAIVDRENPRQIHCRNTVARIPAGVAKVFTCNVDPVTLTDAAIRRRVTVVNVY